MASKLLLDSTRCLCVCVAPTHSVTHFEQNNYTMHKLTPRYSRTTLYTKGNTLIKATITRTTRRRRRQKKKCECKKWKRRRRRQWRKKTHPSTNAMRNEKNMYSKEMREEKEWMRRKTLDVEQRYSTFSKCMRCRPEHQRRWKNAKRERKNKRERMW